MPAKSASPADLFLLTAFAGAMDALSYLSSGVFTANMTGNTVVLGLAIAGHDRSRLLPSCVSLTAFACGAALAAVAFIRRGNAQEQSRDLKIGTAVEFPFALSFAILRSMAPEPLPPWLSLALIATAACALGIQSVAVRRMKISGVVTTFITGTITTAIVSVAGKEKPKIEREESHRNSPPALGAMFCLYILAAAAAAWLATGNHLRIAAWLALTLLVLVMLRSWVKSPEVAGRIK